MAQTIYSTIALSGKSKSTYPYTLMKDKAFNLVTSAIIKTTSVYAPYTCVVLYVSLSSANSYTVIIQYDADKLFKFSGLSKVNVNEGDIVHFDTLIGIAEHEVKFEYLTSIKRTSEFPVRVNKYTYFKQDPNPVLQLDQGIVDARRKGIQLGYVPSNKELVWTSAMLEEFNDGRGDYY